MCATMKAFADHIGSFTRKNGKVKKITNVKRENSKLGKNAVKSEKCRVLFDNMAPTQQCFALSI